MGKPVFANVTAVLAHAGQRVGIKAGEAWDDADPLVKQYPDMFTDAPQAMRSTTSPAGLVPVEQPVERATRAPGEKRGTRR